MFAYDIFLYQKHFPKFLLHIFNSLSFSSSCNVSKFTLFMQYTTHQQLIYNKHEDEKKKKISSSALCFSYTQHKNTYTYCVHCKTYNMDIHYSWTYMKKKVQHEIQHFISIPIIHCLKKTYTATTNHQENEREWAFHPCKTLEQPRNKKIRNQKKKFFFEDMKTDSDGDVENL